MTAAKILRPVRLAGRVVYEAIGSNPLSLSGNSISVRMDKSVLDTAGLVDDDRSPVDSVDGTIRYRLDPEQDELSVEVTFPIQDDAPVYQWLQEEEFGGAESAAGPAD